MSQINILAGPFNSVFCGPACGVSILTQVFALNTDPFIITDNIPEQYEPVLINNSAQTGFRQINMTCSFYGDDSVIVDLARR